MKRSKKVAAFILSALLVAGSPLATIQSAGASVNQEATTAKPLPFRELSADEMVEEMGTGWNLGNTMDGHTGFTPNETLWQTVETTEKFVKAVHDIGFNTIRIPVTWGTMIDDENGYAIDEDWMSRVQDIVDYAVKEDMYVIINIHHDGAEQMGWLRVGADDLEPVKEKFAAVWEQIAVRFENYDEHVIFESMNEVKGEDDSKEGMQKDTKVIMELNQIFVDTVRSTGGNNDKRWLSVPGRYTNIGVTTSDAYGFDIPRDPKNHIFVAVHYYDWFFGLMETHSNAEYSHAKAVDLQKEFEALVTRFTSKGIPVILGEYGAINKDNTTERAYFNEVVNRICQMDGVVPVYWDNGSYDMSKKMDYSFTLIDRDTTEVVYKEIVDAIMRGTFVAPAAENLSDIQRDTVVIPIESIQIESIQNESDIISLQVGEDLKLNPTISPENSNDVLLWKSNDATIATVYHGMIRAKGIGSTTITAYSQSGSLEYEIPVTVYAKAVQQPITEITVNDQLIELETHSSYYINPSFAPVETQDYITYVSLNPEVASVSSLGKVVAKATGTTYVVMATASGITAKVPVKVTNAAGSKSISLALNVYYNDNAVSYFGNEVGESITVTGDGQYTLSFDCSKDLSGNAVTAGVTGIENFTAVYIKDDTVTKGKAKKSPLVSCDIMYDKVVVDGMELTITQTEPKSALKSSGILDTNDPLNGWDGSQVSGVTVTDHSISIDGMEHPQKIDVTFTLSNMVFDETEIVEKETEITGIAKGSVESLSLEQLGAQGPIEAIVSSDDDSYVSFISSNEAVAVVTAGGSIKTEANGTAVATIQAMGAGICTITAMTENGLECTFEVQVNVPEPTTEETLESAEENQQVETNTTGITGTEPNEEASAETLANADSNKSSGSYVQYIIFGVDAIIIIGFAAFIIRKKHAEKKKES